jgi:GNAT superfamily N-acetyltransferase
MQYRVANRSDVQAMARIRAASWGSEEYWTARILAYMDCEHHPQQALAPRIVHVALDNGHLVGLIAGHLTRRYGCDGELEWIDVVPEYRGAGVSSVLLRRLAAWFIDQKALRICVDVVPENTAARHFYRRHGASNLNKHWLVWDDISVVLAQP